jgi:hypothetical protein
MAKAEPKTRKTGASAEDFLNSIKDEQKRKDSFRILEMMQKATGDKPEMWGASIVGFGNVALKYASGRELDWPKTGFSPRKQALTLYVLNGSKEQTGLLKKLGKHKTGKSCLYINRLADVNTAVLQELIDHCARGKNNTC